jgi:hypothetical protein
MGVFDLDFSHLCAVVAPDRIPLLGNEHRITRIAFDMFRLDDDKENLWQVQADDDGNEFLVRTYELPKDEALQVKSEWSVVEDGKKASLTVVFKGMPIHRMVGSEYGARTPDDVKLLRDLIQAKLTEPEFASSMLASMSKSKCAALLETFPKLAALPKIPQTSGKDPLEGIKPIDPSEYGSAIKKDRPLPPSGDWEKHPQTKHPQFVEDEGQDPWAERDFQIDIGRPKLREEAKKIVPQILAFLKARSGKKISLQKLYMELEVNDIPLYLALHALVKGGLIHGVSPYDAPSAEMATISGKSEVNHNDLFYSVGESVQNVDEGEKKDWAKEREEGLQHLEKMVKHRTKTAIEKVVTIAKEMGHGGHFEKHELPMLVFNFGDDVRAKEFLVRMDKEGYYGMLVGPGWAAVKL